MERRFGTIVKNLVDSNGKIGITIRNHSHEIDSIRDDSRIFHEIQSELNLQNQWSVSTNQKFIMADLENGRRIKRGREQKQPVLYNPTFIANSHAKKNEIRTKKLQELSNDWTTDILPLTVQPEVKQKVITSKKIDEDANEYKGDNIFKTFPRRKRSPRNAEHISRENEFKVSKNEKANLAHGYILVVPEEFDMDKAIEQAHTYEMLYASELLEACLTNDTMHSDIVRKLGSVVVGKLESNYNDFISSICR